VNFGVAIATKFVRKFIYSIFFLKSYHNLHPLSKIESSFVNNSNEDNSLDIFKMVIGTNEFTRNLINPKIDDIL
jgi:hypothetical protein